MTISYENFSTFAEVETLYKNVKPMAGRMNKGKNIRPLASRKRSWEQVVKISNNCYVLENRYGWDNLERLYKEKKYSLVTAPIVWRKHRDGTETVTVSNGVGPYAHTSHYSFLERFLPIGLRLRIANGKQFINMASTKNHEPPHDLTPVSEEYYLAKRHIDLRKGDRRIFKQVDDGAMRVFKRVDDGARLIFKRVSRSRYEFVKGGKPIPKAPRKIVNKKLKSKYKKYIEEFYNYSCSMKPILKFTPRYNGEHGEYGWQKCYESKQEVNADIGWHDEILREIIKDPDHKYKLNLVIDFLNYAQDISDRKKFREVYNRWINKNLGFIQEKR